MYWMYIEFFSKKQAGKDVPKMCRRINQRFLKKLVESQLYRFGFDHPMVKGYKG